jgi:hypothetical protein
MPKFLIEMPVKVIYYAYVDADSENLAIEKAIAEFDSNVENPAITLDPESIDLESITVKRLPDDDLEDIPENLF